jgi:NADP-reducing hydrogenase subunit HndA
MAMKTAAVPFTGTPEQEKQLLAVIAEQKSDGNGAQSALLRVLQEAQSIYGYLPIEVQRFISEEMNIPLEKVYGVSTFYSQFSLNPKGKYRVSVCLGTACYVKGSGEIFDKLQEKLGIGNKGVTPDGKFSLEDCRCIGACGLAPVMTVNDDVYGRLTGSELDEILEKYK